MPWAVSKSHPRSVLRVAQCASPWANFFSEMGSLREPRVAGGAGWKTESMACMAVRRTRC